MKIPRQENGEGKSGDAPRFIYFIQPVGGGPIKIGTTTNLLRRFNTIQSNSPVPLKLVHYMDGGRVEESMLHEKFKDERLWGEWFSSLPVLAYLRFLKSEQG